MIRLLIEKELRESLHSARWAATFGVSAVLILLCFVLGARYHTAAVARYEAALAENARQAEGLTDWQNHRNHRIFLPPQPLEALVAGISADVGRSTAIQGRDALGAEGSRNSSEPLRAVFRFLDLEFLFQVVLSLLVIVFAYDTVSGEKERGTLRLALAGPVPRSGFLVGKLAGTLLSIILPLLVALLAGCLLLPVLGVRLTGDEWLRLALITVAGLIYLGTFAACAVLVSALTHRVSSSFLVLLAIWIALVLVIPRASVLVAGRAVPVKSVAEIDGEVSRLRLQLAAEDLEAMNDYASPPAQSPEEAIKQFETFMSGLSEARQSKVRVLRARLEEQRTNQQAVQYRLALGLARLSPAAIFSLAVTELAGTALDLPQRFRAQAAAYQQEYSRFILAKTGRIPGDGLGVRMRIGGAELKPVDASELPQFRYQSMTVAEVAPRSLFNLVLLLLAGLGLGAGAAVAFARYDAR